MKRFQNELHSGERFTSLRLSYSPSKTHSKVARLYMGSRQWRCSQPALIDGHECALHACAAFERPCRNRFPVPDRIAKHPQPTESRSNGSKAVPRRGFHGDFYRSSAWLHWFRFSTLLLGNYYFRKETRIPSILFYSRKLFSKRGFWILYSIFRKWKKCLIEIATRRRRKESFDCKCARWYFLIFEIVQLPSNFASRWIVCVLRNNRDGQKFNLPSFTGEILMREINWLLENDRKTNLNRSRERNTPQKLRDRNFHIHSSVIHVHVITTLHNLYRVKASN